VAALVASTLFAISPGKPAPAQSRP
jgi:hypothetical protein